MKTLARRSFLRFASAVPLAAGALAKQAAESLSGAHVIAAPQGISGRPPVSGTTVSGGSILSFIKRVGFPAWKRKEIRQEVRWRRCLDPDIAAMQSWSLTAKFEAQWSRDAEKYERSLIDGLLHRDERESWLKRAGIDWL